MSRGHEPITGLSLIVTLNEQDEEPHELVAVHDTAVVPVENEDPEAGEQTTVGAGAPVAVGLVHVAIELHCVMLPGHALITGVSFIVTLNEHEDV